MKSFEQLAASREEGVAPKGHIPGQLGFRTAEPLLNPFICEEWRGLLGRVRAGAHLDLAGLLQGEGKILHRVEALVGVFGQGSQHHLLDTRRDSGHFLMQRWRGHRQVLHHYLSE
jgi:hypothetical protein